jgi:cytochrome c oxidase cbb3-type subunit III
MRARESVLVRSRAGAGVVMALAGALLLSFVEAMAAQPASAPVGDFPRPPADPVAVARGKQVFSVNCGFCHGSDGRGGEGGPNLLRSPLVLSDHNGEVIYAVTLVGRPDKGMPKFDLSLDTVADIAAYIHGIPTGRAEKAAFDPNSILVGDAAAGKAYFYGKGHCSQCHSLQGDFAMIGSRLDPKTLQDDIISAGVMTRLGAPLQTAPPRSVTVTLPSGEVIHGILISIDDFNVSLTDSAGARRTLPRDGDQPRVEIKDPLQAHLDHLREWEDSDIHNLTAFLVKQK